MSETPPPPRPPPPPPPPPPMVPPPPPGRDPLAALAALDDRAARREAPLVDDARTTSALAMALATIDAPVPSRTERVLLAVGVPDAVARTLVSTPSLRRSWFLAMAASLLFGLGAVDRSGTAQSLAMFLALAPLVPVLGVALAYGPGVDPAYEMTLATPISGLRLVLLRSLAVLGVSVGAGLLASVLADVGDPIVFAWLLPAIALSAVCLALSTALAPRVAGGVVAGGWLAMVGAINIASSDNLIVFRFGGQIAAVVVALVAAAVVASRRERFEQAAAPW